MELVWGYENFAAGAEQFGTSASEAEQHGDVEEIPLVIESRFMGHGAMERWMINGKSYPDVPESALTEGRRYRLRMQNKSMDDHPMHMHRHTFELTQLPGAKSGAAAIHTRGIMKDTVLARAGEETVVELVADNPGKTLFHCHQQNHMDLGFMMLFRYA